MFWSLGASQPAQAQCTGAPDNTVCSSGPPGTYSSGINVSTGNTAINVTLQPGVEVTAGAGVVNAVSLSNTTVASPVDAPATLIANDPNIEVTHIIRGGPNQSALRVQASGNASIGDAMAPAQATILVRGTDSTNAVWAIVFSSVAGRVASVYYDGPITATGGANSTLIQACANDGCGLGSSADADVIIDAAGNLTGIGPSGAVGNGITGLFAASGGLGNASVLYRRGTIDVSGTFANGIFAAGEAATVTTDPGTNIIVTGTGGRPLKPGIAVDGSFELGGVTVNAASTIQMLGPAAADPGFRNNGFGIRASSFAGGPIDVNLTPDGSITTAVPNGIGIAALAQAGGPITVTASGPISTGGIEAHGIWANSTTGPIEVNATNISTTGQFSAGVAATGGGNVTVNIASGGSVMGGWQPDVTGAGQNPTFGEPAAGVILSSTGGTATLNNLGSIGALSDRAVLGDPVIINNGTMTGFVTLMGASDYQNNGTFNLRHFADTDGDGVRDTLRVAVSDLGTPGTFANNGTLALLGAPGATTLDDAGQYLPDGNALNAMALGGPVQGQILGAINIHQLRHHQSAGKPCGRRRPACYRRPHGGHPRRRNLHFQRRVPSAGHGAQQRRPLTVRRAGGRSSWPRRRRPDPDRAEYRRCRRPDRR